jgi:hypothetical protein
MGDSRVHLRAFAFAAVLIVVSGLLIGLFQEARAVSIQFSTAPASVGSSSVFRSSA